MIFNISAGHNPDGMPASGAVGLLKESTEVRKIKDRVIELLNANGHTAYDSTCDDGTSVLDVLQKICAKSNSRTVDFDVSIHLNSGVGDTGGDDRTTGTEVLILNASSSKLNAKAKEVCDSICALGFKSRGVKSRPDLYFLRETKALALLVECFFLDDKDDVDLYNVETMAQAIVKGLIGTNITIDAKPPVQEENKPSSVSINVGDTIKIVAPYGRYIADDVQKQYGIVQVRENVLAGGVNAFEWHDNGIPEQCIDLTNNNGNKRADSDEVHPKVGDFFNFPKPFTVVKTANVGGRQYLKLDFNGNSKYQFWVIAERCQKV